VFSEQVCVFCHQVTIPISRTTFEKGEQVHKRITYLSKDKYHFFAENTVKFYKNGRQRRERKKKKRRKKRTNEQSDGNAKWVKRRISSDNEGLEDAPEMQDGNLSFLQCHIAIMLQQIARFCKCSSAAAESERRAALMHCASFFVRHSYGTWKKHKTNSAWSTVYCGVLQVTIFEL
jgi:hypothetical protein